jgi:guanylate kinase
MPGKLFVISAPSGAGKTTLVTALINDIGKSHVLERVVTYTSKSPRPAEVNGVDYHFITPQEFERRIAAGFFLEWSTAYGTYYGTPASIREGLNKGTSYIIILDRVGAQALTQLYKDVVLMWIEVSSLAILEERLKERGQDTPEQIARRLVLAQKEIESEKLTPFFHYHVMNSVFEDAYKIVKSLVCNELQCMHN